MAAVIASMQPSGNRIAIEAGSERKDSPDQYLKR
jgi:hypothetical protein